MFLKIGIFVLKGKVPQAEAYLGTGPATFGGWKNVNNFFFFIKLQRIFFI